MNARATAYDVVIVGARCGGATLGARLAAAGWRTLLVDRRPPPADVVSTHLLFPNTVARLGRMGVLERISRSHRLNPFHAHTEILGHRIAGRFSSVDGVDYALAPRRTVLDLAILETAVEAGAEVRFGNRVVDLLRAGDGTVTGVKLDSGAEVGARWVVGADGRHSTVAGRLGLEKTRPQSGEWAGMYGYWRGVPGLRAVQMSTPESNLTAFPCEDDVCLLFLGVPPDLARGNEKTRLANFMRVLKGFPLGPSAASLEKAEQMGPLHAIPTTMMEGFFRTPTGPGWALVGDATHFKHPATGQGIADAIEHAHYVADRLTGDGDLTGYEAWRDDRSNEHYEFSFQMGSFPRPEIEPIFAGLAADPVASQDFLDIFTRHKRPRSDVFTDERIGRWLGLAVASAG